MTVMRFNGRRAALPMVRCQTNYFWELIYCCVREMDDKPKTSDRSPRRHRRLIVISGF